MIRLVFAAVLAPVSAQAAFECIVQNDACLQACDPIELRFEIDRSQFVAPQHPNDPPRRQVTTVQMDGATFVAEAIMMPGGVFGFFEDADELGSRLFIMQPDGSARLSLQPKNETWIGTCTR